MTDFGLSVYKVKPDLKCYLYLSQYGNVLDELMKMSLDPKSYIKTIRHPFNAYDLGAILGVGSEKQSLIIRDAEKLNNSEWLLLDDFLSNQRIKNLSVFIIGVKGSGDSFEKLRARVSRQGIVVEATDPTTLLSQKHLSEWFGDQCIIHVSDAYAVCRRLGWDLGDILWVVKSYQSVSGGRQLDSQTARRVLQECCPDTNIENAYYLLIQKKAKEALAIVSGFNYNDTLTLFNRLDYFLKEVVLIKPHVIAGLSAKSIAEKSGVHVVKVLRFKDYVSRYSDANIKNCQSILDFGFDNIYQPNIAEVVVSLWS